MKFYGHPKREHVVADKGKVVLFAALLKDKSFQHNEQAIRIDPTIYRVFTLFSPAEIDLAVADSDHLESPIVVLDASTHKDVAEESAALAALRLEASKRELAAAAVKKASAEEAVKVAAAKKKTVAAEKVAAHGAGAEHGEWAAAEKASPKSETPTKTTTTPN